MCCNLLRTTNIDFSKDSRYSEWGNEALCVSHRTVELLVWLQLHRMNWLIDCQGDATCRLCRLLLPKALYLRFLNILFGFSLSGDACLSRLQRCDVQRFVIII